jgi:hypothetical protein
MRRSIRQRVSLVVNIIIDYLCGTSIALFSEGRIKKEAKHGNKVKRMWFQGLT